MEREMREAIDEAADRLDPENPGTESIYAGRLRKGYRPRKRTASLGIQRRGNRRSVNNSMRGSTLTRGWLAPE